MPFPLLAAGIAAGAGALFSLIGNLFGAGDRAAAEELRKKAMAQYNIELPSVEEIHQQALQADPRLRQAEMDAVGELQDVGTSGGLRLSDRSRLNQVQGDASARERGQREAIQQNAAARGLSGSGMEYAATLQAQQSGADRERQAGLTIAGQAQDASLQAIRDAAGLAGQVRGEDFREGQYNREAGFRENAFNVGQHQQQFQNSFQLANARAQGYGNQADAKEGRARDTAQVWGGVGQAVGQGAATVGQWSLLDKSGAAPAAAPQDETPYYLRRP